MSHRVTAALVLACHLLGGGIELLLHRHVDGRHHEPGCDDASALENAGLADSSYTLSASHDAPAARHRHDQCRRCTAPVSTPGMSATTSLASHAASSSFSEATTRRGSADADRVHAPRGPPLV